MVTDLHIETSGGGRQRRGRSTAERSRVPVQRPFKQPRLPYKPTEVVSADELESIHDASMRILEEIGMDFLDPESRDLLAKAGARVDPVDKLGRTALDLAEENGHRAAATILRQA